MKPLDYNVSGIIEIETNQKYLLKDVDMMAEMKKKYLNQTGCCSGGPHRVCFIE